jgi:hypothetical protein
MDALWWVVLWVVVAGLVAAIAYSVLNWAQKRGIESLSHLIEEVGRTFGPRDR